MRQKENKNAARDRNMGEYMEIEGLLDKIALWVRAGSAPTMTLPWKSWKRSWRGWREQQATMKSVNAYYRKHKTLEGCPGLSVEDIGELQSLYGDDWRKAPVPYPSFLLTNNNANIRRVRQRINDLKNRSEFVGWTFPGGEAKINEAENRLQLFFDEKPPEDQRRELKSGGFQWAPSQGAWRCQLTRMRSVRRPVWTLRPEDGRALYQLQPFARKAEKDISR